MAGKVQKHNFTWASLGLSSARNQGKKESLIHLWTSNGTSSNRWQEFDDFRDEDDSRNFKTKQMFKVETVIMSVFVPLRTHICC